MKKICLPNTLQENNHKPAGSVSLFLLPFLLTLFLFISTTVALAQTHEFNQTNQPLSHQVFQVSFIPYFGTNGLHSPETINTISLNILAGYNGGTKGIEIGGLFNIDKYEVNATQIAGIGNHGGLSVTGVQIGGVYNISKHMTGTQLAGISNISHNLNGVQIAGIHNQADSGSSVQIAGLFNVTNQKALFQLSGMVNRARSCRGTQIAGLLNTSAESTGSQIAGILNISKTIKGTQIGLINIADSSAGIPVGLINIVRNGYKTFEISADEMFGANLAFRSGVEKFHAILTAGVQPHRLSSPLWSYGVGAGTSRRVSPKMLFDADATFHHVIKESHSGNNYLYRINAGIDRRLNSRISAVVGISYNFLVTDTRQRNYREIYSDIVPYSFSNTTKNNSNLKTWAGFKAGIRFW